MKKVLILGSSGSGKSTLAVKLGCKFDLPVLHMDSIYFEKGWKEREKTLFQKDLNKFIQLDRFIIDGNYYSSLSDRLKVADTLIFLNYNRFYCLYGALKRYKQYKNKSRPSIAKGCNEKIDYEFVKWIIWDYPKKKKDIFERIKSQFNGTLLLFNSRKQLNKFLKEIGVEIG